MWQIEFTDELRAATSRERKDVLAKYMHLTGRSKPHLYRVAKENGFTTGRTRSDKGVLKSGLSDEQVEFVAALMYVTGRENKGPIMPVERALQIAEMNGIVEEGQVAPVTMSRILRERQLSKRHMMAPTPHVDMRSLHPNHAHVYDVSVCIQYYLKNGRLAIMDERDFYKNKPENFAKIKERLLRYVVVDHFSGAFYFKYYNTTGETQDNLFDFLREAWGHKQNEKLPFRGVPFQILMDTGAANKSKAIVAFLERLGCNIPKGLPYNPRRQGACETQHDIIEGWFESCLRIQPAYTTEQLNAWALDFMVWFQAKKAHSRHGMPRTQCWMLIKPNELRELPDFSILQNLYANPEEERTVDGTLMISFRGKVFSLKHIDGLFRGAKVKAILKPYTWPVIEVLYQGNRYEVNPIETLAPQQGSFRANAAIIGSDYSSQPETLTEKAGKRFANMAYGEEKKKDAIPFEGLQVFGSLSDDVANLSFMEKTGTPIQVDKGIAEKRMPIIDFFKKLRNEVGAISPELNQSIREQYGDSIDIKEAEELVRQVAAGGTEFKQRASM